jgi:hypothetical protein
MWYRRTILINLTTTTTSRRTPQILNRQPILRRTMEIALPAVILVISPMNVRTASGRAIKN